MNEDKKGNKTIRQLTAISMLLRGCTKDQLISELEIKRSTFFNYINELDELGIKTTRPDRHGIGLYQISKQQFWKVLKGLSKEEKVKEEIDNEGVKVCKACSVEKNKTEFSINRQLKDNYSTTCKECNKKKRGNYYKRREVLDEQIREKLRLKDRVKYEEQREQIRIYQKEYYEKTKKR